MHFFFRDPRIAKVLAVETDAKKSNFYLYKGGEEGGLIERGINTDKYANSLIKVVILLGRFYCHTEVLCNISADSLIC